MAKTASRVQKPALTSRAKCVALSYQASGPGFGREDGQILALTGLFVNLANDGLTSSTVLAGPGEGRRGTSAKPLLRPPV